MKALDRTPSHPQPRWWAVLGTALIALLIPLAGAAEAQAASPWWHLTSITRPTNLVPGEEGEVVLTAANLGTAPVDGEAEAVAIEDHLPAGLEGESVKAEAGFQNRIGHGKLSCELGSPETVHCEFTGTLGPYAMIEVRVRVKVQTGPEGAESGESNEAEVSGGGAPSASISRPISVGSEPAGFGFSEYDMSLEEEGSGPSKAAGSHDFQLTTSFALNQGKPDFLNNEVSAEDMPKDIDVKLPPGLIGNPSPFPTCPLSQFNADPLGNDNNCPESTVIGVALATISEPSLGGVITLPATPIVSLQPAYGEPARFGFVLPVTPVLIETALRDGEGKAGETASEEAEPNYGITAASLNTSEAPKFLSAEITIWGTPGDSAHDSARGSGCLRKAEGLPPNQISVPCTALAEEHPPAFQTLPTACSGEPLATSLHTNPWAEPSAFQEIAPIEPLPTLVGCNQLSFKPEVHAQPTSDSTSTGTGFDFELNVNDEGLLSEHGRAQSQIKKAVVALPEGIAADASLAEGLGVCPEAAYRASTLQPGSGCPETSKIGEVEVESPLVTQKLHGSLYIAEQERNPFGSLLAMYMVIKDPELGVLVKAPGKIEPDPNTGQLITTFDNLPQLPISHFRLHLREGQRAPLINPPACGTYAVKATIFPWSDPSHALERESAFKVTSGVGGGPCPGSPLPFHPGFEAGSINNVAGSYSPFSLRLTRADGEQDMTKFSATLPPGMVGKLAGVAKCPQADVEAAKRLTGRQEQHSPSCPANSQIGTTLAGAGVGSTLVYVPGKLYLGGAYHGDPLSVVAIVPAVAGPFDVGDVVVQEALDLNPITAEVEVDGQASDPIPHSLRGIPLNVREIRVATDRPDFTLNPTSCERSSTRATLWAGGTSLHPTGESPFALASPFQAADCASLGFKPKLAIHLKGGTRRGRFPALKAVVTPRPGDANFSSAVVTLPHSAFLEQGHFGTICTRVQFAAGAGNGAGCPAASIYGQARAWSPLLEEVLEGPVYLRSSSHNLPDLVVALHGLVTVDLAARIDSFKGGIRSTFESIPDAPVSRFILEMQGGKKGLIVNSTNLCVKPKRNKAKAGLAGQNGKRDRISPVVRPAGCHR